MKGLPQPKLGPLGLTKHLLATEGVPGLYRGLTATFIREIPGYFFFFLAYEGVRELVKPEGGSRRDVGAFGTVGAGAVAGEVCSSWPICKKKYFLSLYFSENRCGALEYNLPS